MPDGRERGWTYGTDRNAHDVRQLPVRQPLQFAAYEQLTEALGQLIQRASDQGRAKDLEGERLGIGRFVSPAMLLFVEWFARRVRGVRAMATTCVTNDSEEPGPPIAAAKRPKISKRPEGRFLHDIFRVVVVPHQPACQPVGGVEVRHNDFVEIAAVHGCHRSSTFGRHKHVLAGGSGPDRGTLPRAAPSSRGCRRSSRSRDASQCAVAATLPPQTALARHTYDTRTER